VSADGRTVYLDNQDSNDLVFIDTASRQVVRSLSLADGPRGIAVRHVPPGGRTVRHEDVVRADFDGSGRVDFADFLRFARAFGTVSTDPLYDPRFDFDGSGRVDFADFLRFAGVFGRTSQ